LIATASTSPPTEIGYAASATVPELVCSVPVAIRLDAIAREATANSSRPVVAGLLESAWRNSWIVPWDRLTASSVTRSPDVSAARWTRAITTDAGAEAPIVLLIAPERVRAASDRLPSLSLSSRLSRPGATNI